jgi:AraC family transcriptional regulator
MWGVRVDNPLVMHDAATRSFQGLIVSAREAAGLCLSENVYTGGTALPKHTHARPFFSLTLAGAYVEHHPGRSVAYDVGSIGFHPAGEEHSVAIGGRDVQCLNVEVRDGWLDGLGGACGRRPSFVRAVGGPLVWLGRRVQEEVHRWSSSSALTVEALVLEMLGLLSTKPAAYADGLPPRWLDEAEEMLRHEYSSSLTVACIAARIRVHPVHLSRTWRRFRRCSIGDALRRLRIDEARRRLAAGPESLAEVALDVGFADQAQFTRAFRRVAGVTPGAYRRRARGAR